MEKSKWKELLKKSFGKNKDDKYHAIAMLIMYGIFVLILIILIRIGNSNNNITNTPNPTPSSNTTINGDNSDNKQNNNIIDNEDINYSYSYTVTYNGMTEVYLGKKINNKEKFTLVKNGVSTEYAILNDNYLISENGIYHITNSPSSIFKYCDISIILSMVDNEIPTVNNDTTKYQVTNQSLAINYKDKLINDNELKNSINLLMASNVLKSADMDLSNYISAVEGKDSTLTIHMDFVDIGTTDDFDIKVS